MTDVDENIFPEEGFPTGGEEQPQKAADKPQEEQKLDTPWLKFMEKYPQYMNEPLPEGMKEAVLKGETPVEAYLRIENARLEQNLQLMRVEKMLRNTSSGPAASSRAETPEDDFAAGLLYGG